MPGGRSDLARLLTLMGEAHDLDELEPFTPVVLDRVADSLGCEFATYYELDITTGEISVYIRSSYEEASATWGSPPYRFVPRVALARHVEFTDRSQDGVSTWSDVYPRAVRRRFEITPEQSALGVVDTACMTFGERRFRSCWLTLAQSRTASSASRAARRHWPHCEGHARPNAVALSTRTCDASTRPSKPPPAGDPGTAYDGPRDDIIAADERPPSEATG